MRKLGALTAVALLGLAHNAMAADIDGKWEPVSNTAVSITGAITVSSSAVTFSGGKSIKLASAGDKTGEWTGFGGPSEGHIFKLEPAADPELLNGNQLCGIPGNPVTYIVLAVPTEGELSLIAFTGDKLPEPGSDSSCAVYNYAK